jgi:hypothetical protein
MKKITNEIKAKIFAPYVGAANVFNENGIKYILEYSILDEWNRSFFKRSYIELTPLSDISDEDLNHLSEILGVIYPENFVNSIVENSSYGANPTNCIGAIDYLRSKGYALPYMDYSISYLVENGIIKLKTK